MRTKLFAGALVVALFWAQTAFAGTAAIQSLSPGSSVMAKSKVTFTIVANGFIAQTYQIADSFSGSTVNPNSTSPIDGGGNFSWVPLISDIGTHTFTITARDFNGDSASVTQTINVLPLPSVSISSVAPGNSIMPGNKFTFHVTSTGFTNPSFIVGDSLSGSGIGDDNLDSSGNFSWTPDLSQNGKHTIIIYANDSLGHNAQASIDVQVGAGPTLFIGPATPGTTINAGTTISFSVSATNFTPSGFSVSDAFPGSTISNGNINTSGNFVWTPSGSDAGTHVLTFKGQVGAFGDSATSSETILVVASGASTTTPPITPPPPPPSQSPNSMVAAAANAATSGDALSSLQNQLASLLAQIHTQSSTTANVAAAAASPNSSFTAYLKPGVQNDQVIHLQQVLTQLGYFTSEINGYYGQNTEAAVIKFQAAHHLDQLGVVGPGTRSALNALIAGSDASSTTGASVAIQKDGFVFEHFMGYGDDDPDVMELQKLLSTLGFLVTEPSGFYGNATVTAVKKFQVAHSLSAVGYVDKETRAALNQ